MVSYVVSQKLVEEVFALFRVIPAEAGIRNGRMPYAPTKIPGFRVAQRRTDPGLLSHSLGGQHDSLFHILQPFCSVRCPSFPHVLSGNPGDVAYDLNCFECRISTFRVFF